MKKILLLPVLIISISANASIFRNLEEDEALSAYGSGKQREIEKKCLNTLSWNIFKGKYKKRYDYVMKNVYANTIDLFIAQETSIKPIIIDSFKYFKNSNFQVASTFELFNKRVGGVATGMHTIPNKSELVFSAGELGFTTSKVSLLTKYDIKNSEKTLIVVNIHAINFVWTSLFKDHIDRTFDKLSTLEDDLSAVIFAGDFNTWNGDRYTYLFNKMRANGFIPTFSKKDKRTKMPLLSKVFNYFNYHLDHIFVKNLKVKYTKVHKINASDHRPLFVKLCF